MSASTPAENPASEQPAPRGRPWPKGTSGNPGGRPRRLRELEDGIWSRESRRVLKVIAKLRDLALDGNVEAARIFLDRVLGKVTVRVDPRPAVDPTPTTSENVREAVIRLMGAEVASLTAAAAARNLTPDELAVLVAMGRVLLVAAREDGVADNERLAKLSTADLVAEARALVARFES